MVTANLTGHEYCAACGDDGWVELVGTVTIAGTTYSRGMAPCKWCEVGQARYQHALSPPRNGRRWIPESQFDGTDILPVGERPDHVKPFRPDTQFLRDRAAAGCSVASLQAMFPRKLWPSEWAEEAAKPNPLVEDEAAEIAEKVEIARVALESDTQEPVSAPEEALPW